MFHQYDIYCVYLNIKFRNTVLILNWLKILTGLFFVKTGKKKNVWKEQKHEDFSHFLCVHSKKKFVICNSAAVTSEFPQYEIYIVLLNAFHDYIPIMLKLSNPSSVHDSMQSLISTD